jgi:hypothetical protein
MKKTKHIKIFRFGKYEVPVTIELDDGNIINQVLYFISDPKNKDVDDRIDEVIDKYNNRQGEQEEITISDVEKVMKSEGIISNGKTITEWYNQNKPLSVSIVTAIKEK